MGVVFRHATIVGSGPNGLAAAIELAHAGLKVRVLEAAEAIGGSTRSAEITVPGFLHDICSAIHPLGVASPFFRTLPLEAHGLRWIHPPAPLAHPFDDGTAAVLERSIKGTGETLGPDSGAYTELMQPLVDDWEYLVPDLLGPPRLPRHPLKLARFGIHGLRSAIGVALGAFSGERARGLFAGIAAHSMLSLDQLASASFGLVLAAAGHANGWPVSRGGSQKIADALASVFVSLGGDIVTGHRVDTIGDLLRPGHAVLCDLTPREILRIAGNLLPKNYRRKLERFRYGAAAYKIDWALSEPIPWRANDCSRAGTVHLGGTLTEIAHSEAAPSKSEHVERPFIIVVQPSLFDPTRAPAGLHTAWAYCHVPNGSTFDMTARIESQVERFAPGFRDCIIDRRISAPADLERYNPNLVGGDISGGSADITQLFFRPTLSLYSTPLAGLYICSSSTPPGGGVHGMCGYHAARRVLARR